MKSPVASFMILVTAAVVAAAEGKEPRRLAACTEVIQEMLLATTSEREGRLIDVDSAGSMEKKKQEGYF